MKVSDKGLAIIENFEGLILHPYKDQVGVPTIGYGTTFYEDGTAVTMKDEPITKQRAIALLQHYVDTIIIPTLTKYVTVQLTQNQIDALASFIYNEGKGAFKGSHLLVQINAGAHGQAITDEFNKWVYANHKKLNVLVERRAAEAKLYNT